MCVMGSVSVFHVFMCQCKQITCGKRVGRVDPCPPHAYLRATMRVCFLESMLEESSVVLQIKVNELWSISLLHLLAVLGRVCGEMDRKLRPGVKYSLLQVGVGGLLSR